MEIFFDDNRLVAYYFSTNDSEYDLDEIDELCSGYDQNRQEWRGSDLVRLRQHNQIIREFFAKSVFLCHGHTLLGSIRECLDGTWLADSPYDPAEMDGMETYGFKDQFYAIQYLHQLLVLSFPDIESNLVAKMESYFEEEILEETKIFVLSELMGAALGYTRKTDGGLWLAHSFYQPNKMKDLVIFGFTKHYYASRYLFQIGAAFFPDIAEEIPQLAIQSE